MRKGLCKEGFILVLVYEISHGELARLQVTGKKYSWEREKSGQSCGQS